MTSLNYHQRFKGSLNPIRELFQISLPNSISFDKSLFNEFPINQNSFFHEESLKLLQRSPINSNKTTTKDSLTVPFKKKRKTRNAKKKSRDSDQSFNSSPNQQTILNRSAGSAFDFPNTFQNYHFFSSNDPFYIGWDKNLRKFILTSRFLSRTSSLNKKITSPPNFSQTNQQSSLVVPQSVSQKDGKKRNRNKKSQKKLDKKIEPNIYKSYSSWPFSNYELNNFIEIPYSTMYESSFNILNNHFKTFSNLNSSDDIDKRTLFALYTYKLNDSKNKLSVYQLPQNIYKLEMKPTFSQDIFGPFQNSWTWPGSFNFSQEYFFSKP